MHLQKCTVLFLALNFVCLKHCCFIVKFCYYYQMLPVSADTVQQVLGPSGPLFSSSPVVTVEPRRRRFHAPINLMIPAPETTVSKQGKPVKDGSKLHLLYSITGNLCVYCVAYQKINICYAGYCTYFSIVLCSSFVISKFYSKNRCALCYACC